MSVPNIAGLDTDKQPVEVMRRARKAAQASAENNDKFQEVMGGGEVKGIVEGFRSSLATWFDTNWIYAIVSSIIIMGVLFQLDQAFPHNKYIAMMNIVPFTIAVSVLLIYGLPWFMTMVLR